MSAFDPKRTSIHPLLLHLNLLGFEPNWRRPKPWEDGYVRRREFIKVVAGSAAIWPLATLAQQSAMPIIGYLSGRARDDVTDLLSAFREGLASEGFVEGRNVAFEYRWAEGHYERIPAKASELVNQNVTLIVASGSSNSAVAAAAATNVIPIVFLTGEDPVRLGIVASLSRPGGNATGVNFETSEIEAKRLGLLHELVPKARSIAVLTNPSNPTSVLQVRSVETAAKALRLDSRIVRANSDLQINAAFALLAKNRADALLVTADAFFNSRRVQLVTMAAQVSLPAIYELREYAAAGGLVSYGPNITTAYREMGVYAGKILKGAEPRDLPVVQPTKFDLVINLKTAKTLGLSVPPTLLARADEVIE
jgi:putative ABC transport system substrate-binding protein